MAWYLLRRLLAVIPTLWALATVVFFLLHLIPGDPVDFILGEQALVADREALRHELKLDRPLPSQYGAFLTGIVRGEWGNSLFDRRPVLALIGERYPATLELASAALCVALLIALPGGIVAALKQHTWVDGTTMLGSLFGISVPNFWLGPLLILFFSLTLGWFPTSGREASGALVLPAFTMGAALAAILSRMTRASMLDVLAAEYVTTARAKGVPERWVILKHALRNALNPVITIVGLQVGTLLAGAVVTEKIFAWPGVGTLLLTAIQRRDYSVVQGCVLVIAAAYVVVNTLTDCLYRAVDPRVRL